MLQRVTVETFPKSLNDLGEDRGLLGAPDGDARHLLGEILGEPGNGTAERNDFRLLASESTSSRGEFEPKREGDEVCL